MFHVFVLFCLCWRRLTGVLIESLSVMEDDSVTLPSGVNEIKDDDDIVWRFGSDKSLIAQISKTGGIFSIYDVLDGRFRDRLKLDKQTGSLTITNITTEHAGDYKLDITEAKLTSKTFTVSVYARLPAPVVIIRNLSSSSPQSNCSVVCSVVNVSAVSLSWYKGNSLLSSISVSNLSISLVIPLEVEYQKNNAYSCVINNTISNQTQQLNVTQLSLTCPDPPESGSLTVCISAVGSLLVIFAVGIFCICQKKRKTGQEEEITYTQPVFHKRKAQKGKIKAEEGEVVYVSIAINS